MAFYSPTEDMYFKYQASKINIQKYKTGLFPNCSWVSTTVWMYLMDANKMFG